MRIRYLLPLVGMLALAACKDEKKAENAAPPPPPPPATTAPANHMPPPATTNPAPANKPFEVRGFAWTGHAEVKSVSVSADGGKSWQDAALEPTDGQFGWHRFRATIAPAAAGAITLIARATDSSGRTHPLETAPWNPAGYCNNGVHRVSGTVAG